MGWTQQVLLTGPNNWTPALLPNVDLWWHGEDATINATPQFDWPNRTGGSFNYGQNTAANEPTLPSINGHQVVQFASTQFLIQDPNLFTYTTDANTMIAVLTKSSVQQYAFAGNSGEGGPSFISGFSSKDFEYFYNSSERATFATSTDSNLHILAMTRTDNTGNSVGYFDDPTTSVFSIAVNSSRDWHGLTINSIGRYSGTTLSYNGKIADIVHCAGILGASDLSLTFNYFKALYAL